MADFRIDGIAYQSRMMDGEVQTLVLKRLLPAFAALMSVRGALVAGGGEKPLLFPVDGDPDNPGEGRDESVGTSRDVLMPVARELASLSDGDVKFIMDACLDVTKREVSLGTGWADVRQRGLIQDQADRKFITRLTITWNVLGENFAEMLGSFGVDMADLMKVAAKPH